MTKFLYIVDHFIPFPASEYGGVWNVIAESNEECFDLITSADNELYPEFYGKLRENISHSNKYELVGDAPSEVVESFLT